MRNLKIPNATLGCDELSIFLCFWRRKRAGFSNPAILGHSEHLSEVKKLGLYRRFSGMYWMSYTIAGKQHHESTGTHDKKLATKIVLVRSAEIAQGRHRIVPAKSPLLSTWSDDFLDSIPEPSTRKRYTSSVKHLKSVFPKARLAEITPRGIELFKQYRLGTAIRTATVNRDLAVLRRMLKLATQQRLIGETPFTGGEFLEERKQRRRPHILTWNEQTRLLAVAPPRIRMLVTLGTESGLRTQEMLQLRWTDVDLENEILHVKKSKTVSGVRTVPISGFLKVELLRWQSLMGPDFSEWVFPEYSNTRHRLQGGRKSWKGALKKADIPYFRQYDLRHCFASRLSAVGTSPITIAHLLGHSSTGILMTYVKAIDTVHRDAILKLDEFRQHETHLQ